MGGTVYLPILSRLILPVREYKIRILNRMRASERQLVVRYHILNLLHTCNPKAMV